MADDATQENTSDAGNATETVKTFDQETVNRMIGDARTKARAQALSEFGGLSPDEVKKLKIERDQKDEDELIRQKRFEEVDAKRREEIGRLQEQVSRFTIDSALVKAAQTANAVNADDVAKLLRPSVKLGSNNQPVVLDSQGEVTAKSIDDLVSEFLKDPARQYMVSSGAKGVDVRDDSKSGSPKIKSLDELDLVNSAEDRKIYKEHYRNKNAF